MMGHERRERILDHLRLHGRVQATEMAAELEVSEITVRRDLNLLDRDKLLTRTYGGAVRKSHTTKSSARLKVGVIVPVREYYYSEVLRGAAGVAESLNTQLLIGVATFGSDDKHPIRRMEKMGVDGLLLTPPHGDADPDRAAGWLADVTVPAVLMERAFGVPDLPREFDHVRSDHAQGAVLALRHLRSLGHVRVAVGMQMTPTAYWLERGVRSAMPDLGMEGGVSFSPLPKEDDPTLYAELNRMLDDGLARGVHAYFMHTDLHASQLVEIALERGLSIPDDIAIVAYDDVMAELCVVPLTAVAPPKMSIGSTALGLLVNRLSQGSQGWEPVSHTSLLPTLHVRSSCGGAQEAKSGFLVDHL